MRFRSKITLVLLAAGVLPVVVLGFASWAASREELERTVGRMQTQAAGDLALYTDRLISTSVDQLRLAAHGLLAEDPLDRRLARHLRAHGRTPHRNAISPRVAWSRL